MPVSPAATTYASPAIASGGNGAPPVIEIENVVKTFNGRNVLDGVNLTVRRGETLVIMGASGCGKSTLLRCLIGAHKPDSGTIKLFNQDLWKLRTRDLDSVRKRFGILFQSGALFSSMSVGENVALPLREHTKLGADMIDLMVKVKLELVGLREAEDRLPSEISGGMAKRAGLARAIALDPELLFYDEPTSGLDPIMTGIIDGLIVDLARTMNVTSVVVTHDLKSAFRVADRMVVLNNGRIVMQGLPNEVRASQDPFVRRFIHGPVESRTAMMPRPGSGFIPAPEGATLVSSARNPVPSAAVTVVSAAEPVSAPVVEKLPEAFEPAVELKAATAPVTPASGTAAAPDQDLSREKRDGTRVKRRPGSRTDFPFFMQRKSEANPESRSDAAVIAESGSAETVRESVSAVKAQLEEALKPVPPEEAADELAHELRQSHSARTDVSATADVTQIIQMETMMLPGLGDVAASGSVPPSAATEKVKTADTKTPERKD